MQQPELLSRPKPELISRPSQYAIAAQQSDGKLSYTTTNGFESLNYDEAENDTIRAKAAVAPSQLTHLARLDALITWSAVILTGFMVGCIAYGGLLTLTYP